MTDITFEWLDEETRIIQGNYPRRWTWTEYHENLDRLQEQLDDDQNLYYFVNVYEKGATLPMGSPMPHYNRAKRTAKVGYVMYVTTDNLLKATLRVFLNGVQYKEGVNYDFAADVDEALAIIAEKQQANQNGDDS
jgi:hypothetical protein